MSTASRVRRFNDADSAPPNKYRSAGLGLRLKQLRDELRMSQAEMANCVDVSRSAAAQWESGLTEPGLDRLEALAVVLKTTPEYLAFGSGPSSNASAMVAIPLLDYAPDRDPISVSSVALDGDSISHLGISDPSLLRGFVVRYDPSVEGVNRGDRVVVDTSNKGISVSTLIAVLIYGEPKLAIASFIGFSKERKVRLLIGKETYEQPLSKVQVLGRVVAVIHSVA